MPRMAASGIVLGFKRPQRRDDRLVQRPPPFPHPPLTRYGASFWVELTYLLPIQLDAGDVCGEEVDSVTVEVARCAVVVLGGPGVGMAREDLSVAERNASVEGVGDRGMAERVWADVTGNACSLRDARDHPVGIAAVNRLARHWPQDQRTGGPLAAACL